MSHIALPAHSLAEAYLYIAVSPCSLCSKGSLEGSDASSLGEKDGILTLRMVTTCQHCGTSDEIRFAIPVHMSRPHPDHVAPFSDTNEPSKLIDVARWLLLFHMIVEKANAEANPVRARELGLEAAQCIEEALKFYPDQEDSPPDSAFFHPDTRALFQQHPDRYSRSRLLALRSRLPSNKVMWESTVRNSLEKAQQRRRPTGKPWWRFW